MTPQEQEMIDGLISRVRNTTLQTKDAAAEQHLQQGLGSFPDSLYILSQTVLVQGYGLEQAQSQLEMLKQQNAALQSQLAQAADTAKGSGGSFLSHIFGSGSAQSAPPPQPQGQYQPVNAGTAPSYQTQGYPPQQGYPAAYPSAAGGGLFGGGGGGGFLQGAMQTAAGVAAGELAFRGIEDLFHGFGGAGGERGFTGMGGGETVVNNYYDDNGTDNNRSDDRGGDRFYNPSDDASRDDGGSARQFADGGSGDFSDSSDDTGNFDDTSSFDDGGSNDFSDNS